MSDIKIRFAAVFMLAGILTFTSCGKDLHTISKPLLGTIITITIDDDTVSAASASSAAFDEIARIEKVFSLYNPDSGISAINSKAARGAVYADDETLNLIKLSLDISRRTGGAFDITFASLGKLWNLSKDPFTPPSSDAVKKLLPAINYKNILIDEKNKTIRFLNPDTKIGLGGIAKGYAVRRAVDVLKSKGIKNAIIACAGDIQVLGSKNGTPWLAGIKHPREAGEKSVIGTINLFDGECISTSGDYERFRFYEGKRYHHIINPATGYPSESGLISVTIICDDPITGDAYATSAFVAGMERGRSFLKEEKSISFILIGEDLTVYVSKSLMGRVEFRKDTRVVYL
jgi:thiamine biosynthesis lipoprotein